MLYLAEILLDASKQICSRATLEHLADKDAARLQHRLRNIQCGLHQPERANMVGRAMARGGRGHIRKHHIHGAGKHVPELRDCIGLADIQVESRDAGQRRDVENVGGDNETGSPTFFAATWLQPPGAAPRSSTRAPGFRK